MSTTDVESLVPKLPTELSDLIIDQVACSLRDSLKPHQIYRSDILPSLVACSLVSKQFHNRISYHLFSTITLNETTSSSTSKGRRTISGLLGILDSNPTFASKVHTLKLYTAATHLHAQSLWDDVDPPFSTILSDVHLPDVLSNLTGICSLHILHHHHVPFRFPDLTEVMKSAMAETFRSPSLTRLQIVGFSELPHFLLSHCTSLRELEYHELSNLTSNRCSNITSPFNAETKGEASLPFKLRYASFTGCNALMESLIAGEAFSELKTFKHDLRAVSDIFISHKVISQAAASIEVVRIGHLHAPLFLEKVKRSPIAIDRLFCLREIYISSFGSFERHGTQLLLPLADLLSSRSANSPRGSSGSIETVKLDIFWGSVPWGSEQTMFDPDDLGWTELDLVLSKSPHFHRLKNVLIRFGWIVHGGRVRNDDEGANGTGSVTPTAGQLREEISSRMNNLFVRLKSVGWVTISIIVECPIFI